MIIGKLEIEDYRGLDSTQNNEFEYVDKVLGYVYKFEHNNQRYKITLKAEK